MLPWGPFKTMMIVYTFFWRDVNQKQIFSLAGLFCDLKAFCRIYSWGIPTEKSQCKGALLLSWRAWVGPYIKKISIKSETLFDKVGLFFPLLGVLYVLKPDCMMNYTKRLNILFSYESISVVSFSCLRLYALVTLPFLFFEDN